MQSYIRVSEDVWVNPDKVEMVFIERFTREGLEIEEPYVVVGFAGGGGRALPPETDIRNVLEALETRVDWVPEGEREDEGPKLLQQTTIVNEAPNQPKLRSVPWKYSRKAKD